LTEQLGAVDNATVVVSRLVRKSAAGLAVLGVLALALLPPEHVHATETHDGHHSDVVHRHYEPHHPMAAGASVGYDEDHQTRWLDSPFIGPQSLSHVYQVDQLLHEDLPVLQPQQASRRTPSFVYVSTHDPPWATSHGLRAPPLLFV
jgi:hypothetical protein